MRKTKPWLQILNVLALLATLFFNGISNTGRIGGRTVGSISDQYPVLFTPAGFTFSIWGLIYLALLVFIVYQARDLFGKKKPDMPFLRQIGPWFIVSCLANIGWLFAWLHLRIGLSEILMLVLLLSLLVIYTRMRIGVSPAPMPLRLAVHLPFSLYLGWISVATIANTSILLYDLGWDGWGFPALSWTVFMISVAILLGMWITLARRDIVYGLVIIWALFGIFMKRNAATEPGFSIMVTAAAGMGLLLLAILARLFRPRLKR